MSKPSHNARVSAAVGAGLWVAFLFVRTADSTETELIQKILLLGVLVIIPLGLSLVPETSDQDDSVLYRLVTSAQPVAGAASAVSFLLNRGGPAAILVASWLLVCSLIGLMGISRLMRRRSLSREIAIDAGMLYLPVGAVWLLASRLGIQPMGFGDTIVLLTAVHFHFAGFAAPVLAGQAGRALIHKRSLSKVVGLTVAFVVVGTPLVAAGITFSPTLAFVGAVIVAAGVILLAVLVLGWILRSFDSFLSQALLVVSSLSSVCAMVLACLYAYSLVTKTVIVDIPQMAFSHGILNSFGFALCGLLAWSLASRVRVSEPPAGGHG